MTIHSFLLLSAGICALLHFVWIPAVKKRLRKDKTLASASKAGFLAVLILLRNFFLVGCIAMIAVYLFLGCCWLFGNAGISNLNDRIEMFAAWKERIGHLSETWSIVFTVLILVLLARSAQKGGQGAWKKRQEAKVKSELERLKVERDSGVWQQLPATPEMQEIERKFKAVLALAEKDSQKRSGKVSPEFGRAIQQLERAWTERDLVRRMDLSIDLGLKDEEPKQWKDLLCSVFFSKGFLSTLETTQKLLGRVGTGLLFITLIGIQSGNVINAFSDQIAQLDQLRIDGSKKEAEDSRKHRLDQQRATQQARSLSSADAQRLNQLTHVFERAFAQAVTGRAPVQRDADFRSFTVRREIQAEIIRADHHERFKVVVDGETATDLTPLEREAVELTQKGFEEANPASNIGKKFHDQLRTQAVAADSSTWEKLKVKTDAYFASFHEQVEFNELQTTLADEVIGDIIDAVPGEPENEVAKLARKALTKFTAKTAEDAYEILSEKFMSSLNTAPSVQDAVNSVLQAHFVPRKNWEEWRSVFEEIPETHTVSAKMSGEPPSLSAASSRDFKRSDVEQILAKMQKTENEIGFKADLTETLSDYDVWFTPHIKGGALTLRGQIQAVLGESPASADVIAASFSKAHSFLKLLGSPRVGGILIGHDPGGNPLNFTDLSWSDDGDGLKLILNRGREETTVGRFSKDLIHRALAYASDGRPCTTTIVYVKPIWQKKVALHPALVDTQTGLDAIALDSFTFELIEADSVATQWWTSIRALVKAQESLYEIAWFWRLLALKELANEQQAAILQDLKRSPDGGNATRACKDFQQRGDEVLGLIEKKSEFYDPELVKWIKEYAGSAPDLETFCRNIHARARAEADHFTGGYPRHWTNTPPKFDWVSGVREIGFETDTNLSFLLSSGSGAFWPLAFVLQVAFTTPPEFLGVSSATSDYADTDPWIVLGAGEKIEELLKLSLLKDQNTARVISRMRDFTILQRLFRTALCGKLGPDFPLKKLVALTTASAADDYAKTPRWIRDRDSIETNWVAEAENGITIFRQAVMTNSELSAMCDQAASVLTARLQWVLKNPNMPTTQTGKNNELAALLHQIQNSTTNQAPRGIVTRVEQLAALVTWIEQCHDLKLALNVDTDSASIAGSVIESEPKQNKHKTQP